MAALTSSAWLWQGRKGTGKAGAFSSDSAKKEAGASDKVQAAAKKYLYPIYDKCMAAAKEHDAKHPVLQV